MGQTQVRGEQVGDGEIELVDLADLATQKVIGRNTSGPGTPEAVSLTELLDWLHASVANGDIIIRTGGAWTRLGVGSDTEVLTVVSGSPAWAAAPGGVTDDDPRLTLFAYQNWS